MTHSLIFASLVIVGLLPVNAYAAAHAVAKGQFKKADRNRDKVLNPGEFKRYVDAMAKRGSRDAKKITAYGAYNIGFSRADGNGDGKITLKELGRFK